jgi:hypothetical protein
MTAAERALVVALDFTEAALKHPRSYKARCAWCKDTMIAVSHPLSDGICDACLEREFPEDPQ